MAHTYTNLLIHALFSTQDRRPFLDRELKPKLFAYRAGIMNNLRVKPVLINGPRDHVHLLFVLPAEPVPFGFNGEAESQLLEVDSRALARPALVRLADGIYGVQRQSVEPGEGPAIHLLNKKCTIAKLTYREEVLALLQKHGIEYDPRFGLE